MLRDAASLVIIDHHKVASWASDLDEGHYDPRHAGCVLAWWFFNPGPPIPPLLLHIDDRDRWVFRLDETRDVVAGLLVEPRTFEHWQTLAWDMWQLERLQKQGAGINAYANQRIREIAKHAKLRTIGGVLMWVCNGPRTWRSDLGHVLAKRDEGVGLVYTIDEAAGVVHCSLRSDGRVDVSKIASVYGGGGHATAAGFRWPLQLWPPTPHGGCGPDLERHDTNASIHA